MTATLARMDEVCFAYGTTPVLDGVSLEVRAAELLFVIGPNGSGKTTALELLGGLLEPSSGEVRVFGADPARGSRRGLARKLAYTPQSYHMSFPFTALEIALMGRYAHQRRGLFALESQTDLDRAQAAMQQCGVWQLSERRWNELSGGEQRRVLLAQALCQEAQLLLLDEPTAALDPAHGIQLLNALRDATSGGSASVVVSHDLNLAARFADRVALVHERRIAAIGSAAEVLASDAVRGAFGVELHIGIHSDGRTPFAVPR